MFHFACTTAYYHSSDALEDVKQLLVQREPTNMGMRRFYDLEGMQRVFGWRRGAYERSTAEQLMPNIAVYCHATVQLPDGARKLVHVLNLVGYALDSPRQPDYAYFRARPYSDLVVAYTRMWQLALACAKDLKEEGRIHRIHVYNVGGGAFAGPYSGRDTFGAAFTPLRAEFERAGIEVIGYDWRSHTFDEHALIPDILEDEEEVRGTLFVNAWDPWSFVGNGNASDHSLDGAWGQISNMSVLAWPLTNPQIRFRAV